jgi:hypothetical protein
VIKRFPDNAGSKLILNVVKLVPDYAVLQPNRQPSSKVGKFCNGKTTASLSRSWLHWSVEQLVAQKSGSLLNVSVLHAAVVSGENMASSLVTFTFLLI